MSSSALGQVSNRPNLYNEPKITPSNNSKNKELESQNVNQNIVVNQNFTENINIASNVGSASTFVPFSNSINPSLDDIRSKGEVMQFGHSGDSVVELKIKLNEFRLRNNLPLIEINSNYDLQTQEVVKQFQQSQGLEKTGQVGPTTLGVLETANNQPFSLWTNLSSSVMGNFDFAKNKVSDFGQFISNSAVGKAVGNTYDNISASLNNFNNSINSGASRINNSVSSGATRFNHYLANSVVGKAVGESYNNASVAVSNAGQAISNSAVGQAVGSTYNSIGNAFSTVKEKFSRLLDDSAFAVGEKLKDAAELVEKLMPDPRPGRGKCYTAVKYSLAAMGIPYVDGSASAHQAVKDIFENPKYKHLFKKMEVSQSELKNLPAGAIIIWGKTKASPHGHIGIADGNGKDLSDKDRNALSSLRGSQKCTVFFPTGTLNPPNSEAVKIMQGIENKSLGQMQRAKA